MLEPGLIFGVLAFGFAVFSFWRASRHGRRAKLIGGTEMVPLAEVKPGLTKVRAKTRFGKETLEAPLTGSRCAYFCFEVFQLRGGRVKTWYRTFVDVRSVPFLLVDGEKEVTVDPSGAEVHLAPEAGYGDEGDDLPPSVDQKLQQRYQRSFRSMFSSGTKLSEAVLEENEKIFVLGTAERDPNGKLVIRQAGELFVLSDEDEGQLAYQANHRKFVGYFQSIATLLGASLFLWLYLR